MSKTVSENVKFQLMNWVRNALQCELFPNEQSSLTNAELPAFKSMEARATSQEISDDNNIITLTAPDGKVYSILVKLGDYSKVIPNRHDTDGVS